MQRKCHSSCGKGHLIMPDSAMSLDFESTVVAQNRGPTYDDAYLKELKASTPNARHIVTPAEDDMSVDISETAFQTLDVITGD